MHGCVNILAPVNLTKPPLIVNEMMVGYTYVESSHPSLPFNFLAHDGIDEKTININDKIDIEGLYGC